MSVSVEKLENFIVKAQPDLEIIKQNLSAFNIFNVLGIQHREIRHSNFLGWLLDPNESHNLEDVFLKELFKLMRKVGVLKAEDFVSLLLQDLSSTQVYRESVHNIDILIVNEKQGLVICIENKINADYSDHQLEKYYNYVEENYNGLKNRVYLTLTPFKNQNHFKYSEGKNYTNINYKDIVKLLKTNKDSVDASIPTIRESINQYIAMVEKSVIHSSDEVRLAQSIYKKYKNEIEFIIKNKPDFSSEKDYVIDAIKNGVLGDFEIVENDYHTDIIRILPKNETLKNIFKDSNFQSWGGNYVFCLELFIQKTHIWLKWSFGDIRTDNNKERDELQSKKTVIVNEMKTFNCFKNNDLKIDFHNGKPEDSYTGICGVNLFYYDTYLNQDKSFIDFLKVKFEEINSKLIEPWTKECIEKLTK